ncbi:MAG: carbohydrate ABC transporter permease [Clostridiales bacterium]|nr:carbohydrate ABC transporter permease [Clostridiales bacterium]
MKDRSRGDRVFQAAVYAIIVLIAVFTLYPLIYSLSASVSEPREILNGHVWLYPVNITTNAYQRVFRSADIQSGYLNTIIYAVAGTALNLLMTIAAAYPLSMKDMKGRNFITIMITFTMFFSGGMIPTYINIKNLGLLNTRWSVILPGLINVTNLLILRNYFINSVPDELHEAAEIDGSSPMNTLFTIILPLSKSILVVITIYYFVAHWNAYFDAMMYITKRNKWPLQVFLRQILLLSQMGDMAETMGADDANTALLYASLKYAIIIIAALPLIIVYPLVQKFFEKGIMLGSVKG